MGKNQIPAQPEAFFRPRARRADLIVHEILDEVLIYDLERHRAHCLNPTAARVWRACEGRRTVAEIASRLTPSEGAAAEAAVWLALAQLNRAHLLETPIPQTQRFGHSRRAMLRRFGRAAIIGLPLITSLLVPEAAQAGSYCAGLGELCVSTPCCAGLTCVAGVCQ